MKEESEQTLVKKYPTVFSEYKGHPRKTAMAWGMCVGDGWYTIIDELCSKLEPLGVVAAQVKEKFGGLRFYINPYPSEHRDVIEAAIREAEIKASKTCEDCGQPGKARGGGWVRTLCDKCQKKRK